MDSEEDCYGFDENIDDYTKNNEKSFFILFVFTKLVVLLFCGSRELQGV